MALENGEVRHLARKTIYYNGSRATRETISNEHRNILKLSYKTPHRNIIDIFGQGWLNSRGRQLPVYFIDMELGGQSLDNYIRSRYHPPNIDLPNPAEIWDVLHQIASGVGFMHNMGIIHRDLKPANSSSLHDRAN